MWCRRTSTRSSRSGAGARPAGSPPGTVPAGGRSCWPETSIPSTRTPTTRPPWPRWTAGTVAGMWRPTGRRTPARSPPSPPDTSPTCGRRRARAPAGPPRPGWAVTSSAACAWTTCSAPRRSSPASAGSGWSGTTHWPPITSPSRPTSTETPRVTSGVEDDAVASGALRRVEVPVGLGQQSGRGAAAVGGGGDADAGGHGDPAGDRGPGVGPDPQPQVLAPACRLLGRHTREDQEKLLATKPGGEARTGRRLGQQIRDVLQHGVAGVVRERVIDPLEVVQVDDGQRQRRTANPGLAEQGGQPLVDVPPVVQAGQRVPVGHLAEVLADPAGFGRLEHRLQRPGAGVALARVHGGGLGVERAVLVVRPLELPGSGEQRRLLLADPRPYAGQTALIADAPGRVQRLLGRLVPLVQAARLGQREPALGDGVALLAQRAALTVVQHRAERLLNRVVLLRHHLHPGDRVELVRAELPPAALLHQAHVVDQAVGRGHVVVLVRRVGHVVEDVERQLVVV